MLCRTSHDTKEVDPVVQILVPEGEKDSIWQLYHEYAGHWGPEKTISLIKRRYFWPKLNADVINWCSQCKACVLRKAAAAKHAPLIPIKTSAPMELLSVDFLSIGGPEDLYHNVLVMVDHFSKFAWAAVTKDQTAVTTAKALWSKVIQPFGAPRRLLSDQGPNFESQLVQELCELYGIKKDHTTPYHPAGNGACERLNRTLLGLLGTLGEERRNWRDHLPEMIQVYNHTVHSSTGYSPHYLMFGRHGFLPQDRLMGLTENVGCSSVSNWVQCHQRRLQYAFRKAQDHRDSEMSRQKKYHDLKADALPLLPGERVLLQDLRARGRGKLADRWEQRPYVVIKQADPDLPVYVIRQEGGNVEKVMHRNLMRPCLLPMQQDMQNSRSEVETARQEDLKTGNALPHTGRSPAAPPWVGFWLPTEIPLEAGPEGIETGPIHQEPRRSTRTTKGLPPQRFGD